MRHYIQYKHIVVRTLARFYFDIVSNLNYDPFFVKKEIETDLVAIDHNYEFPKGTSGALDFY